VTRKLLDHLYDAAAYLAAFFLIGTLMMVLTGIAGRAFNFYFRGTDAYAGYCMAAAGFLALAHTLRRGEHIRVTLVLDRLPRGARYVFELWCHGAALFIAVLLALFSARLAWQSYTFNDISQATDATPLWVPQLSMALGTIVLAIAFVDAFIGLIRSHTVTTETPAEAKHIE